MSAFIRLLPFVLENICSIYSVKWIENWEEVWGTSQNRLGKAGFVSGPVRAGEPLR